MNLAGMVGGSLTGIKTATDIANGIKELISKPDVDVTATKQLVSEVLDRLIQLQTDHVAMQRAVADLVEEQRRMERFQSQAERYALKRTELGSLVYELKESQANGDPPHCICATCYDRQVKSILNPTAHNTLTCNNCGGTFYKPDGQDIGIRVAPVRHGRFDGFL